MPNPKQIRKRWLTIRMSDEEYKRLNNLVKHTTSQARSDYCRRVILKKPVTVKYRNASLDDFLSDMLALKKELNAIGNNFNQSVHKLHSLDKVSEIQTWAVKNEEDKRIFFEKIDMIFERMNQLYKLWSQ